MDEADERELLRQALDERNEAALVRLIAALTPVIQARVARCLWRWGWGAAAKRDPRQEVADLTQDVFVHLFEKEEKVLRRWNLERGLRLFRFVDFVTEKKVISILRVRKRRPPDDFTLPDDFDLEASEPRPDVIFASREEWRILVRRLKEVLSPRGRHLFDLLFTQELTIEEVATRTGMSPDAIYAWRSRLKKSVRRILDEVRNGDRGPKVPGRE